MIAVLETVHLHQNFLMIAVLETIHLHQNLFHQAVVDLHSPYELQNFDDPDLNFLKQPCVLSCVQSYDYTIYRVTFDIVMKPRKLAVPISIK